ncbi:MAG: GlxA family transcriptional regulator [Hyphomicrobiales bacterium]|nr:GlxA family transcriptional regulator [Hyphomicrobiales bacterium]MCP5001451.1 GlxA family transcriptional regulator [Hyphomicrobiales bacterium]
MRDWFKSYEATHLVGILLFEQFSNHCLANTIEPLRAANSFARRTLYEWRYLTLDGKPVASSSGLAVEPDAALRDEMHGDILFVLPSYGYRQLATPECLAALRAAALRYDVVAGLDAGSWLLAEAGLLQDRRATIHWQELERFAERFPDIDVQRERFIIDGDRITCGGAMAAFDLASELIGLHYGEALRVEVGWLFMHEGTASSMPAPLPMPKTGPVQRAVQLMQQHLEGPLPVEEIARRVGQNQRALEQRFKRELGATPRTVYRRMRLLAARRLVDETEIPVGEIALRCGYEDPSAMTRAFRMEFGLTPRAIRSVSR